MNYQNKITELLNQADYLENGETKVMLLEEAIRLADSHQDIKLGFEIRNLLTWSANFSGNNMKCLVAFTWCLATYDKHPQTFNAFKLLWHYKWIIESINEFPQISRQKFEEMLEDMKQRYISHGYSLRPYYSLSMIKAVKAGEKEKAREFYQHFLKAPRDSMSDPRAGEIQDIIDYRIFLKEYSKALEEAKAIFEKRVDLTHTPVPELTYARLLLPMVEMKKYKKAKEMQNKGYQMISGKKFFAGEIGDHILFLSLQNISRALKLLEKHLDWVLSTPELGVSFKFFLSCWILMERMLREGKKNFHLRLPSKFPLYNERGKYAAKELGRWFEKETWEIAKKFDGRNGTARYKEIIEEKLPYIQHEALSL